MNQIKFLQLEFPHILEAGDRAEALAEGDPQAPYLYPRRTVELAVIGVFETVESLALPYRDNLCALIHEPRFIGSTSGSAKERRIVSHVTVSLLRQANRINAHLIQTSSGGQI